MVLSPDQLAGRRETQGRDAQERREAQLTCGLDMSTSKVKTAAVALRWGPDEACVVAVRSPLESTEIAPLIAERAGSWWAVDVQFGWPDAFADLVHNGHLRALAPDALPDEADWQKWRIRTLAQRRTDAFCAEDPRIKTRPLSVSFDRLGATAAVWTLIEARLKQHGVDVDRAGIDGRVCETYPRAVLAAWGITTAGKLDWLGLCRHFPFLSAASGIESALASEDVCDAVVCAMAARARALGHTFVPRNGDELSAARREGWIHVPTTRPCALLG